jgi:hypothetical protein
MPNSFAIGRALLAIILIILIIAVVATGIAYTDTLNHTRSSSTAFTNSDACPVNQNFEGSCVGNWQAYFWITVNCTCRWNVSYTAPSDVKNVAGNYSGMGYNSTQIFISAFGVVEVSLCANATKLDSTYTTLYFGNQNTSLPFHPLQVCQTMGI